MFSFEKEMQKPVKNWVSNKGLKTKTEVKTHGKIPDVVGFAGKEIVVTVELKIKDWKRALYQATINTVYAHESYIAMPAERKKLLQSKKHMFEKWGVGVLIVHHNGEVEVLLISSNLKDY